MSTLDTTGLIKTDFTVEFTGLVKVLQDMHKKVTQNTRLLSSLTEDFFQMRTTQDELRIRNRDNFARVDSQREATYERVTNLERLLDGLPESYVTKSDFAEKNQEIDNDLAKQTDRIAEVENCTGGKVAAAVEKHITRHLRNWYIPVREKEAAELKAELSAIEAKLDRCIYEEVERAEGTLSNRITETAKLASQELSEMSQEKDKQLASFRKLQTTDRAELQDLIHSNETTSKRTFAETEAAVTARFAEGEAAVASLYYVLNVLESDALHLYTTKSDSEEGVAEEDSPDEDRRVTLMHATLPYLELRSKTQRDIRNRVKQSKEEDQDDFSKHIIELQRELKKKTDTARVLQMLYDNMDKGLYETVDFIKTKVALMEASKVSGDHFCEAMKSKCDVKVVEQKADRSFVNSLFEFLRAQFEQFQESQRAEVNTIVETAMKTATLMGTLPTEPGLTSMPAMTDGLLSGFGGGRTGDSSNLAITSTSMFNSTGDPPSARTVKAHPGAVDEALNPDADYQWASQLGQRQGMPPARVLKSRESDAGRPSTKGQQRGKAAPDPKGKRQDGYTATWAEEQFAPSNKHGADDPSLPPLAGQDRQAEAQRQGQQTRAHDAYRKAVQPKSTVSDILETTEPGAYIPESLRSQFSPHPPA